MTAILSARTPELLMSVEDMRRDGAEVMTVTDLDGTSDVEQVEDMLHLLYSKGRMGAVYVCGSNRLMLAAQRVARRLGLFGEVALEQQMAGCVIGRDYPAPVVDHALAREATLERFKAVKGADDRPED
mgnify:CR=1 FL=1